MTKSTTILSAAIGALLAGNAGVGTASAQEITLWTLNFSNKQANDAMDKIATDFAAANPGATVTVVRRGTDDHKTALRVAAGSDKGPDIYFSWAGLGLGGEYVKAGLSAAARQILYRIQVGRPARAGGGFLRRPLSWRQAWRPLHVQG